MPPKKARPSKRKADVSSPAPAGAAADDDGVQPSPPKRPKPSANTVVNWELAIRKHSERISEIRSLIGQCIQLACPNFNTYDWFVSEVLEFYGRDTENPYHIQSFMETYEPLVERKRKQVSKLLEQVRMADETFRRQRTLQLLSILGVDPIHAETYQKHQMAAVTYEMYIRELRGVLVIREICRRDKRRHTVYEIRAAVRDGEPSFIISADDCGSHDDKQSDFDRNRPLTLDGPEVSGAVFELDEFYRLADLKARLGIVEHARTGQLLFSTGLWMSSQFLAHMIIRFVCTRTVKCPRLGCTRYRSISDCETIESDPDPDTDTESESNTIIPRRSAADHRYNPMSLICHACIKQTGTLTKLVCHNCRAQNILGHQPPYTCFYTHACYLCVACRLAGHKCEHEPLSVFVPPCVPRLAL